MYELQVNSSSRLTGAGNDPQSFFTEVRAFLNTEVVLTLPLPPHGHSVTMLDFEHPRPDSSAQPECAEVGWTVHYAVEQYRG